MRHRSVGKDILFFAGILLWLPLFLLTSYTGWGMVDIASWQYWYMMRKRGRYVTAKTLAARSSLTAGTIIIDTPSPGMGLSYMWWTPDEVLANAPMEPPKEDYYEPDPRTRVLPEWHAFDRWVAEKYLDIDRGSALKVGIWNTRLSREKAQRRFPGCKVIATWSGRGWMEKVEQLDKKDQSNEEPELWRRRGGR